MYTTPLFESVSVARIGSRHLSKSTNIRLLFLKFSDSHVPQVRHQHDDRSPGTDAICRAASASPTSPMRSVAAPRVKLSSLIVPVDHKDLTGCRVENRQAGDGDAPDHYMGIVRYRARAHEPAAPRHVTFMSGEQLLLLGSPQNHRLYNSDAQPLVFVELRCPLDGDVPATAPELKGSAFL